MCPRRESYESVTSRVLDIIGTRFIVRRNAVYPEELEELSNPKKRKNILNTIRYVIQVLRSKSLAYLIPRRFIINVPLVLIYYRLKNNSLDSVYEVALRKGSYLNQAEAKYVAERIVNEYLPIFKTFIDTLLRSAYLFHMIARQINWDEIVEVMYPYIPYIISGNDNRALNFVKDIRSCIVNRIPRNIVEEFEYSWRGVEGGVDSICSVDEDGDPHVESICRRFMDRVVRYTLAVLFPSHYESATMFMVRNLREEAILRVIQHFGSVDGKELVRILYLLEKRGVDLGYVFIKIGERLTSTQILDDVENLLSRGLLERDPHSGRLKLTVFGQKVLDQKKPSEKMKKVIETIENIMKQSSQ